jgi:hypothetical protein
MHHRNLLHTDISMLAVQNRTRSDFITPPMYRMILSKKGRLGNNKLKGATGIAIAKSNNHIPV